MQSLPRSFQRKRQDRREVQLGFGVNSAAAGACPGSEGTSGSGVTSPGEYRGRKAARGGQAGSWRGDGVTEPARPVASKGSASHMRPEGREPGLTGLRTVTRGCESVLEAKEHRGRICIGAQSGGRVKARFKTRGKELVWEMGTQPRDMGRDRRLDVKDAPQDKKSPSSARRWLERGSALG